MMEIVFINIDFYRYINLRISVFTAILFGILPIETLAQDIHFGWEIAGQTQVFAKTASYGQENYNLSLRAQAELYYEWNDGMDSIEFIPWFMVAHKNKESTHGDIQELAWVHVGDDWELRSGIRKEFWGVTEGVHLVDIINQSDLSRGLDGEEKLGQPMVNLSLVRDWSIIDFFILIGHRKRIFPSEFDRPRSTFIVAGQGEKYESSQSNRNIDTAIRWQVSIDDWELALSHFNGTSREPSFIGLNSSNELLTRYPEINQTGLEVQYIAGDWLWKLESIVRSGQGEQYIAAAGGFEYTQVGLFDTNTDLGWIIEYNFDDRGFDAPHTSERDFIFGARWVMNDAANSQALLVASIDDHTGEQFWSLEMERRFFDSCFINIEMAIFANTGAAPTLEESYNLLASGDGGDDRKLSAFYKDSYLKIEIVRYF